ncbi:MAG: hypothetical protein H7123_05010 [Thermoleophilia bacterium]|nr:hypothetical protein [Thermoleophilia bacterium]
MSNRTKFDHHESTAIARLAQLGTGATALVVGMRQVLDAIDVHPSQLLHHERAVDLRSSARETVKDVRKSKRLKHARGSAADAALTARDRLISLRNSDAAKSTGKAVGVLGAQALKSKSSRKAARKIAPLMMRRGFLVIGVGSAMFVVGRIALRKVQQHRLAGAGDKQINSGERNAELAHRSDAAVLKNVDAPMPKSNQHQVSNGTKTTAPFPR